MPCSPHFVFKLSSCDHRNFLLVQAEFEHLRTWRGREPVVGLALSGGGYIGVSLSYLLRRLRQGANR
jgi:hypothetical protein